MTRDEALDIAMRELEADPADRPEIERMLETPRSQWRACCGSLCTPCVLDLARVVDRVNDLSRSES